MQHEITELERSNLKAVLFGNQKQANVINDSVVRIVAEMLCDLTYDNVLATEGSIISGIGDVLQTCVQEHRAINREFVLLTAGEQSLANLQLENTPLIVRGEQPNPESPKYNFRIQVLGEDASPLGNDTVDVLNANRPGDLADDVTKKLHSMQEEKIVDNTQAVNPKLDETPTQVVERLVRKLAPLCPTGPASELNDDVKAALYVTEYLK